MSSQIKKFFDSNDCLMAILIPANYSVEGIDFVTDNDCYQQIACMGHSANHIIKPHYHNKIDRNVDFTTETIVIRSGKMQVYLYENQVIKYDFEVGAGDILTLVSGGHGFKVLENIDMVEIKQGPFLGDCDKTRFEGEIK